MSRYILLLFWVLSFKKQTWQCVEVWNFAHSHTCGSAKFRTFSHLQEIVCDHVQKCFAYVRMCKIVQKYAHSHMCGCEKVCAGAAENFCTPSLLRWDDNCQVWEPKRYKIQSCNLLPLRPQIRHPVHPPCASPGVQKCCPLPRGI